ncbi:MAG: efflux RND transporter periplasmic adaptor subunit [Beijerinckiaceae bacterium]
MRKALLSIAALAGLAAAGWHFLGNQPSRAANEPNWRTAGIERGSIVAAVNATGTINPTATAIVGSQVSGQVLEILADYNSAVKAGDVLARLNAEQTAARLDAARADLAQSRAQNAIQRSQVDRVKADIARLGSTRADATANVKKAEAQLADAQTTLARQTTLNQRQIASEVALQQARLQAQTAAAARDQAQAQLRGIDAQEQALAAELRVAEAQIVSGEAQVAQREAIVRQIEVDIRNSDIRSPVDGVVIQRNIELGQTVAASLQAPTLFLVAQDLTRIEIYANVDEADVGRVQAGQPVSFSVTAFPAREFEGRVKTVRLGSQTVQNVVIYTAVIEVANADLALKPGMTATLRIFTERRENILRISNAALRWRPPGEQPTTQAAQPAPPPNPFSAAPAGPPGQPGGQNFQRQMLDRMAAELRLDEAQKKQLEGFAREARQAAAGQGPAETPEARRERGRQVAQAIGERLRPILWADQAPLFDAWIAERATQRAGSGGVPGRIYLIDAEGRPALTPVRLGATDGTNTEIVAGAQEGQRAIIGGGPRPKSSGFGPRGF